VADEAAEVEIVRLGAQGDGVAEAADGRPRFVPFALPGERVHVIDDAMPEVMGPASPDRRAPICRHFGICGGCVAQHMSDNLYADWKRGIVVEAFRQRGLVPEIAPLLRVPPGSRRRAVLTCKRAGEGIILGYHGRRSHALFDLEECPVLVPGIVAGLPGLRAIAGLLPVGESRFTVLATPVGLDVSVEGKLRSPNAKTAAAMARIAADHRFARITLSGETIIERASPVLQTSGVGVMPPPGAFVQAVAGAEDTLAAAVMDRIGRPKRAADLFCGLGTFAFALARRSRVSAFDSDQAAVAALQAAARHASGLKPVEAQVRDLFREPLSPLELVPFDAVVLDPPRAGAKAQCEALAKSQVPGIVYVSCDPATLARDARALVDAGYRLGQVVLVDQFLFTAHVELVMAFTR
jgi:23S rRNA (uracil1939-C5)-methyltransferase